MNDDELKASIEKYYKGQDLLESQRAEILVVDVRSQIKARAAKILDEAIESVLTTDRLMPPKDVVQTVLGYAEHHSVPRKYAFLMAKQTETEARHLFEDIVKDAAKEIGEMFMEEKND